VTLFIVMVGWTVFRATSFEQAGAFLALMARPGAAGSDAIVIPPYYVIVAAVAALIIVLQRVAISIDGFDWGAPARRFALASNSALAALFVCALAKGLADPFKPFIYFRF
jgi:alginate O-acetyltransferase complex protein AlgI